MSAPEAAPPVPPLLRSTSSKTLTLRGIRAHTTTESSSMWTAADCKKVHISLNKVTACYRQLVMCVGGTSDCSRLREELEESRKKAFDLSTDLRNALMALLMEQEVSQEERVELERIWVLFLSTLELFQQDLCKAHHLCQLFPLHGRQKRLINTGVTGKTSEVAYRSRSIKSPSSRLRETTKPVERSCSPDLAGQIEHVESMLNDMQMKVSIPIWTVEATEEAWAEVISTCDLDESSDNEILSGEDISGRGCCSHGQLLSRPLCMVS
ncbi:regulator of G-protein signaling 9-binding protein-like [Bombina bombina]|uniref:regulator of G-protein signaling 9-binding protein-like n=1 Tax=Bombina bombina TaxID=8345 RepID=UPI00235A9568|nr:regulator of G-protein signaling 9-binding protein-like [Bombina bombina]XP_053549557.1 regulator of G-protein signaling 9-binding protein-like [Bombina bombina]